MSKAAETRARIIEQAANLFNQQGYAGSSMSDIMAATGLKKGGIYNHFASKDELAIAAFDFAVEQVRQRYVQALRNHREAIPRLQAIVQTFVTAPSEVSLRGGCPLMNTAIESDDGHPELRSRTQQAMNQWRDLICRVVKQGQAQGELRPEIDPEEVATIVIATLEGGLMLSMLYGDFSHLQRSATHLENYLTQLPLQSVQDYT